MESREVVPVVKKVAVGIALKGHTPPSSYHDRMIMAFVMGGMEAEAKIRGIKECYEFLWFSAGEIFIPFAREQLAAEALRNNCDYLFMVDDDMMCPPDLFFQLVKHDVDICAALAFTRNPPHLPVIYQAIEGWDAVTRRDYFINNSVKNYPKNKLVECDAVGFGAVLIKTELFKKMERPWFMGSHGTGEDIHFCYQAKKKGFRVFMDTAVKLGHLGNNIVITEEYSEQFNRLSDEEKEKIYGQYQKYPTEGLVR